MLAILTNGITVCAKFAEQMAALALQTVQKRVLTCIGRLYRTHEAIHGLGRVKFFKRFYQKNDYIDKYKLKQRETSDTILMGAIQNGKRFTFCQNDYILRTSSIVEVVHMENEVKGTKYDDGNNSRRCWYYRNNYQYHCYNNEYHTILPET